MKAGGDGLGERSPRPGVCGTAKHMSEAGGLVRRAVVVGLVSLCVIVAGCEPGREGSQPKTSGTRTSTAELRTTRKRPTRSSRRGVVVTWTECDRWLTNLLSMSPAPSETHRGHRSVAAAFRAVSVHSRSVRSQARLHPGRRTWCSAWSCLVGWRIPPALVTSRLQALPGERPGAVP